MKSSADFRGKLTRGLATITQKFWQRIASLSEQIHLEGNIGKTPRLEPQEHAHGDHQRRRNGRVLFGRYRRKPRIEYTAAIW